MNTGDHRSYTLSVLGDPRRPNLPRNQLLSGPLGRIPYHTNTIRPNVKRMISGRVIDDMQARKRQKVDGIFIGPGQSPILTSNIPNTRKIALSPNKEQDYQINVKRISSRFDEYSSQDWLRVRDCAFALKCDPSHLRSIPGENVDFTQMTILNVTYWNKSMIEQQYKMFVKLREQYREVQKNKGLNGVISHDYKDWMDGYGADFWFDKWYVDGTPGWQATGDWGPESDLFGRSTVGLDSYDHDNKILRMDVGGVVKIWDIFPNYKTGGRAKVGDTLCFVLGIPKEDYDPRMCLRAENNIGDIRIGDDYKETNAEERWLDHQLESLFIQDREFRPMIMRGYSYVGSQTPVELLTYYGYKGRKRLDALIITIGKVWHVAEYHSGKHHYSSIEYAMDVSRQSRLGDVGTLDVTIDVKVYPFV